MKLAKRLRFMVPIIAVLLASPLLGAASGPAKGPAFELAGLAKLEGDKSFALLQEPELTKGAPVLVRIGQTIGPYRLVTVEDDRVVLESATGAVTVMLGGSKGAATAAPIAPHPKLESEARQVPKDPAPVPLAATAPPPPKPTMTTDESVDAAQKAAQRERAIDMLKKGFGRTK